jgi:hypothetical protein
LKKTIETKDNVNNKHAAAKFEISEESRQAFIRAMKIGYYKAFHKQGLLTDSQLERLIDMNTVKTDNAVNDDNAANANNDNNSPAA